jgi:hypothetical protein
MLTMASFETFGIDDDILPDFIESDCPICKKTIQIPLDREENFVVCPHCNAKIEIEST